MRDAPRIAEQALLDELERRMRTLGEVFDLSRLEGRGRTPQAIRRYYERSRVGYRFVHSDEGAMHMALNPDGAFDPAGYEGQALLVHERLAPGTRDVLELACGNGYNLALLAARNPGVRFVGVDLVASQISRARATLAELPGADARIGDFQSLAIGDGSQDCVYVVESLCHATDLPRALGEIASVLRPGGRLDRRRRLADRGASTRWPRSSARRRSRSSARWRSRPGRRCRRSSAWRAPAGCT